MLIYEILPNNKAKNITPRNPQCRVLSRMSVKICPKAIFKLFFGTLPRFFNDRWNILHKIYGGTKILCLVLSAIKSITGNFIISFYSFQSPVKLFFQIDHLPFPNTEHLSKLQLLTPPLDTLTTSLVRIVSSVLNCSQANQSNSRVQR